MVRVARAVACLHARVSTESDSVVCVSLTLSEVRICAWSEKCIEYRILNAKALGGCRRDRGTVTAPASCGRGRWCVAAQAGFSVPCHPAILNCQRRDQQSPRE